MYHIMSALIAVLFLIVSVATFLAPVAISYLLFEYNIIATIISLIIGLVLLFTLLSWITEYLDWQT